MPSAVESHLPVIEDMLDKDAGTAVLNPSGSLSAHLVVQRLQ